MQENLTLLLNENASAVILFAVVIFLLLIFLTFHYKKLYKKQSEILEEKEAKIKSLRQYSYEMELKRVDREHEVEKETLKLSHTIKDLEAKQKEGLKSHVVNMIEAHEKKRTQQLDAASIR